MTVVDIFTNSTSPQPKGHIGAPINFRSDHECLYRYDSEDFIRNGSVRITTLSECRKAEGHRRDAREGTRTTSGLITLEPSLEVYPALADAAVLLDQSPDDLLSRCSPQSDNNLGVFMRNEKVDDAYVFCTSIRDTVYLCKHFGNVVTRIKDPRHFFELLDKALREHISIELRGCIVDQVQYEKRDCSIEDGTVRDITFIKPPEFQDDYEVRSLWLPVKNVSIQPVILTIPIPAITGLLE